MWRNKVLPYIYLNGKIDRVMNQQVSELLHRIPKKSKQLAVVINCKTGNFAYAHSIGAQLQQKTQNNNLELITFAEQYAINAGFLLLMKGTKVYASQDTILGGLEIFNCKIKSKYLQQLLIIQSSNKAEVIGAQQWNKEESQKNIQQPNNCYKWLNRRAQEEIRQTRKDKINKGVNLNELWNAYKAKQKGIIDGISIMHKFAQQNQDTQPMKLQRSKWTILLDQLKRKNLW